MIYYVLSDSRDEKKFPTQLTDYKKICKAIVDYRTRDCSFLDPTMKEVKASPRR
jgi:hypothetical protein